MPMASADRQEALKHLSKDALEEIAARMPDTGDVWRRLIERCTAGTLFPKESQQHWSLAALCLRDLADTCQTAGFALWWAICEWEWWARHRPEPNPQVAVHFARFYFDYSAIALSAASNHLAAAMWHVDERACEPLGRDYKTAAQVCSTWKKRGNAPSLLEPLEVLLSDPAWTAVSNYRDEWIHRGLPVIEGEYREARKQLWRDPQEPPPSTEVWFKRTSPSGRVAYGVHRDEPQYRMAELLDCGLKSLQRLINATERFLGVYDVALRKMGVTFDSEELGKGLRGIKWRWHAP